MAALTLLRSLALGALFCAPFSAFATGDRCPVDGTPCTVGVSSQAASPASAEPTSDLASAAALLNQMSAALPDSAEPPAYRQSRMVSVGVTRRAAHQSISESPFHLTSRPLTYLTDLSHDGELVSMTAGPVRPSQYVQRAGQVLGALAVVFFTLLLILVFRRSPEPASGLVAPPSPAVQVTSPAVATAVQSSPSDAEIAPPTWSDLVVATGGDPARAAAVISGVVAADPSVPPQSNEAIARAFKLVSRIPALA